MQRLFLFVILVLSPSAAVRAVAAPADPFADIRPPERTTAQVREFLRVSPPPFTQEDVDRWLAEVRPVVERLVGQTFTVDPIARVVTREALADALTDSMGAYMMRRTPGMTPGKELEMWANVHVTAGALAQLSLGQYFDETNETLIPAEHYPGLLGLVGFESTPIEQVVKVVLAHELTHALQDQVLGGFDLPLEDEPLLAFRAVTEGHAIYVQALVAEELGLADGHRVLLTALAPARITDVDRATARQQQQFRRASAIMYRGGYRFVRHIAEAGGIERLWDVVASPPVSTDQLKKPGEFLLAEKHDWPGVGAFEGPMLRALGNRLLQRLAADQTPDQIAATMVESVGEDRAPDAIGRIARLATFIAVDNRNTAAVTCMVMQLKRNQDAEWGESFFREQEQGLHAMFRGSGFELRVTDPTPIKIDGSDWAEHASSTSHNGDKTVRIAKWRARRGVILIEVSQTGAALTDDEMVALLQALVDACVPTASAPPHPR